MSERFDIIETHTDQGLRCVKRSEANGCVGTLGGQTHAGVFSTGDETFDIATAWNEEEHGDRIDILNAFKRRTSARIESGFNSQLEEDIDPHRIIRL